MMRSSYVIALLIAAGATAWIASGALSGEAPKSTEPTAVETASPLMRVRVIDSQAQVRTGTLTVRGRTEANRTVILKAETAGRVAAIAVDKGAHVEAGQTLARLDADDRPARLRQAEALQEQRQIEYDAAASLESKAFASRTKVAEAKAALEAAKAAVAAIRLDIARTAATAPFAGVMNDHAVEVGDWVGIGDPVATVLEMDPMKVVVEVPETEAGAIAQRGSADIRLIDGRQLTGRVRYVSVGAEDATRTFRAELELPNPDDTVREGMTAEVLLPLASEAAHKVTPAALTLNDAGDVGVKTVDNDELVHFHKVRIIADEADGVWLAGLPDKTRLIVVGQEFVRDGQKVEPVTAGIGDYVAAAPDPASDPASGPASGPAPAEARVLRELRQ